MDISEPAEIFVLNPPLMPQSIPHMHMYTPRVKLILGH